MAAHSQGKPHIRKLRGASAWWCGEHPYGFGVLGYTPAEAYRNWITYGPKPAKGEERAP